jgi:hypothetical protein
VKHDKRCRRSDACRQLGQIDFAQSNRLYDYLPVMLADVNDLIQCEASCLHDTAWNSHSRAVAPFLDDRTHNAFPGPNTIAIIRLIDAGNVLAAMRCRDHLQRRVLSGVNAVAEDGFDKESIPGKVTPDARDIVMDFVQLQERNLTNEYQSHGF